MDGEVASIHKTADIGSLCGHLFRDADSLVSSQDCVEPVLSGGHWPVPGGPVKAAPAWLPERLWYSGNLLVMRNRVFLDVDHFQHDLWGQLAAEAQSGGVGIALQQVRKRH